MMAPFLKEKIGAAGRADLQGDVGKGVPGQRGGPGPFHSPEHRLLAAIHYESRSAIAIPRQSKKQSLLIICFARLPNRLKLPIP